ncbi:POTRA domain-containing protein [Parahaliea maris]|uniref:POTRA domain-containing protein n=1 Tax=Parahaliea maris TaxID=2716870 RepID=UPI00164F9BB2|nr:POTRA domain-containing protein [Parahaliea maris]
MPDRYFAIQSVEFIGNSVIAGEELAAAANLAGKTASTSGIIEAAEAAADVYHQRGYNLAQVVVPPQDLADGVLRLVVLEGRLDRDGLEVVDFSEGRIDVERMTEILLDGVNETDLIQREPYERALRVVDTMPGVRSRSWLYPGDAVGTARLRAELYPEDAISGGLSLDNHGFRATGQERLTLDLRALNPWQSHLQADVLASVSAGGNSYIYGHVALPVGNDGLMLGAGGDYGRYETLEEKGFLPADGDYSHIEIDARYPLYLTADDALFGEVSINRTTQNDDSGFGSFGASVDFAEASVDWLSSSIGALARTSARAVLTYGDVTIDEGLDIFQTEGGFVRARIDIAHLRRWNPRIYSLHVVGGQVADQNLNGYFQCHIGGAIGNRGYAVGEGTGDACLSLDNELVFEVGPEGAEDRLQLFVIGDVARIREFEQDIALFESQYYTLASVGIGSRWRLTDDLEINAEVAHQLEDSLRRQRTGLDSDNRDSKTRYWLQVHYAF